MESSVTHVSIVFRIVPCKEGYWNIAIVNANPKFSLTPSLYGFKFLPRTHWMQLFCVRFHLVWLSITEMVSTDPLRVEFCLDARNHSDVLYHHIEHVDENELKVREIRFELDLPSIQDKPQDESRMFVRASWVLRRNNEFNDYKLICTLSRMKWGGGGRKENNIEMR